MTVSGTLYVVATPIGNLEDMTARAARILMEVDTVFCEDTRRTRRLLDSHSITTPVRSCFVGNEHARVEEALELLAAGKDVALVTDAGTPAIADPGYLLVRRCREQNIPVRAVPGASALAAALSVSGLPTERFMFFGFLPRKPAHRHRVVQEMMSLETTSVFFEAPHRILATLEELAGLDPDREIVLCRELTKIHESVEARSASDWCAHPPAVRGEFVVLVKGRETPAILAADPVARYHGLLQAGHKPRAALKIAASEAGLTSRELYERIHLGAEDD